MVKFERKDSKSDEETLEEEIKFSWVNEKFGKELKKCKDSTGVIIFYADELEYDILKLQYHIEEGKHRIAKASEISPDKIKVVFGGYRDEIQTEFRIVPKNGDEPVAKPKERESEENIQ
jgi:hypothetical protein